VILKAFISERDTISVVTDNNGQAELLIRSTPDINARITIAGFYHSQGISYRPVSILVATALEGEITILLQREVVYYMGVIASPRR
jgi:hypothetical protein